ncbi:membrane-associating domain-containing protein [Ophiocordyceps camponoti-floridani]|uniref:Membrane-associating domain-containing protein n=1 Tax=Ophiocordyceps camponoti-floridani TaxID=2030778 RepID=A0A8H4VDS8_9HYPO|nr:membrane-associating domain-containing protein [Ophiocordyceps camponoti-floridani]
MMQVHAILAIALHGLCFVAALVAIGLYGKDLRDGYSSDSRRVYAVVVGGLSAVTCGVYAVPKLLKKINVPAASWSLVLFILWIAAFGVFGSTYIKMGYDGKTESDGHVRRMKAGVWVDLVNALLWFVSAASLCGYWWVRGDRRSRFTGRAYV